MSETTADSQPADVPNDSTTDSLRPFIHQISLKTMQLGQVVLDLYAQGQLKHPAIVSLCDELLTLEKTASASLPAKPDADPTPENPSVPTQCPQCHTSLIPGRKFCTTCGLSLASMVTPATSPPTTDETPDNLFSPTTPTATNDLCPICSTILQPNAVFCTHCGHSLGGQPLGRQSLAPTGASTWATPPGLQPIADTMPPPLPASASTEPISQFCQNCGKGLPADIAVCPDCGSIELDPI